MNQRLGDVWPGRAMDVNVRNLAGLLDHAIETSARLRIFAVEAAHDGPDDCARAYERLERAERQQIVELEYQLQRQLAGALADARARGGEGAEHRR